MRPHPSSTRHLITALLITAISALACGEIPLPELNNEGGYSPKPAQDERQRPLICKDLTLAATSAKPLEQLTVSYQGSASSSMAAIVHAPQATYSTAVTRPQEGAPYSLNVPFYPTLFEGGEVEIELVIFDEEYDREQSCGRTTLYIEGIKRAPGTTREALTKISRLVELRAQSLGHTVRDLEQRPLAQLPIMLQGPALAHYQLNHPDNEQRLDAMLATADHIPAQDLEFADAIFAHSGYLEHLDARIEGQLKLNDAIKQRAVTFESRPYQGDAALSLSSANTCSRTTIDVPSISDAAKLSELMILANVSRRSADADWKKIYNGGMAVLGLIPYPPLQFATALHQFVLTIDKHINEAYANQLPHILVNPKIVGVSAPLEEGRHELGTWDRYFISAKSTPWNLTPALFDAIIAMLPFLDGFESVLKGQAFFKQDALLRKLLKNKQLKEAWEHVNDSKQLRDYISSYNQNAQIMLIGLWGQYIQKMLEKLQTCPVPEQHWGPFDASAQHYAEAAYIDAIAERRVVGARWHEFAVERAGDGIIVVNARPGMFPPEQNAKASKAYAEVYVAPVTVSITPPTGRLIKGQPITLTAEVQGTDDLSVQWDLVSPSSAAVSLDPQGEDAQGRAIATLTRTGDLDEPVVVRAMSLSKQAARGREDAPMRAGYATFLTKASIIVEPTYSCLELGQSMKLDAQVLGHHDPTVSWRASGGSISQDGTFKAAKVGEYKLTAAIKSQPETYDTATVQVREECVCHWRAQFSGPSNQSWSALSGFSATYSPGQLGINLFDEHGHGVQLMALNGTSNNSASDANVVWGQPGRYRAHATFSQQAKDNPLFGGISTLDHGPQWLEIERWDDNLIEGSFDAQISLFGSKLLPPSQQDTGSVKVRFSGYVKDTTNIFGLIVSPTCP